MEQHGGFGSALPQEELQLPPRDNLTPVLEPLLCA